MKNSKLVIGVLGGMGTYATINLFKQYAEVFPAEKEWDRPRIIIDNRCTMPSRVRAFLYNEKVNELVDQMADSMNNLLNFGCNKIILACNTSHLFLNKIYEKVPGLKDNVVNIIDECVNKIYEDKINNVYLLGSEGTIDSNIYQDKLKLYGIHCFTPSKDDYGIIRDCIEAVKQNKIDYKIKKKFLCLINEYDYCILGCTELPILYDLYKNTIKGKRIYDPLLIGLEKLKKEYSNE